MCLLVYILSGAQSEEDQKYTQPPTSCNSQSPSIVPSSIGGLPIDQVSISLIRAETREGERAGGRGDRGGRPGTERVVRRAREGEREEAGVIHSALLRWRDEREGGREGGGLLSGSPRSSEKTPTSPTRSSASSATRAVCSAKALSRILKTKALAI